MDAFDQFKRGQKESWQNFAQMEAVTIPAAARLVRFAGVGKGMRVLDVGCGTGVVAVTAARMGAQVTGIDLTPTLLERARENSQIAEVEIEWQEGDVEALPFDNEEFDVVLSQFAHIFAPRPEVAMREMLRVLKPGGTIAFSTWPPEMMSGRTMALSSRYMAASTPGVAPPPLWGDPNVVRQRLGDAVTDIVFAREHLLSPALSPQHHRLERERSAGNLTKLVETLAATNPEQLEAFRREYEATVEQYLQDNTVRHDYLMTRGRKV